MEQIYSVKIQTDSGDKEFSVFCGDVTEFDGDIDILTTSAYVNSYEPTPHTMFEALYNKGVSVYNLAQNPMIDLRKFSNIWLSEEVTENQGRIKRIGCIELRSFNILWLNSAKIEQFLIDRIRTYFLMLDMAAVHNVKMDTVVIPLLGSGSQNIAVELMIVPLVNECLSFLRRNPFVKRLCFIDRKISKSTMIADYLKKSYSIINQSKKNFTEKHQEQKPLVKTSPMVFISYASEDKNIADNLCAKLESRGMRVWYAPRDVVGPYAEAIVDGIERSSYFVVILSENSMKSQHVLNEIDLAFQGLPNNIKFKPLRIDDTMFTASMKYYLSRQHWLDAIEPPLEERLNEFADGILADN